MSHNSKQIKDHTPLQHIPSSASSTSDTRNTSNTTSTGRPSNTCNISSTSTTNNTKNSNGTIDNTQPCYISNNSITSPGLQSVRCLSPCKAIPQALHALAALAKLTCGLRTQSTEILATTGTHSKLAASGLQSESNCHSQRNSDTFPSNGVSQLVLGTNPSLLGKVTEHGLESLLLALAVDAAVVGYLTPRNLDPKCCKFWAGPAGILHQQPYSPTM
jgi:hypothetical protein